MEYKWNINGISPSINGISPIHNNIMYYVQHIMCNAITMRSDVANRVTRMSDASNMTVLPLASL